MFMAPLFLAFSQFSLTTGKNGFMDVQLDIAPTLMVIGLPSSSFHGAP